MRNFERILHYFLLSLIFSLLSFSNANIININDKIHLLATDHAFDFLSWTIDASWVKITQSSLGIPKYIFPAKQHQIVTESIQVIRDIENTNQEIDLIYSNPTISDPETRSQALRKKLANLTNRLRQISPLVEAILEKEVTKILHEQNLTIGGQPIPWVLYHTTPLPQNLVISRREKIGSETNYVLTPLTVPEASRLENTIDKRLGVSSLVVNIGGLASYPTMIMRTADLDWTINTIAHEWTHIYLSQRPLGNNYDSPELRTMNETTASIAGSEIGQLVIKKFYPELFTLVQIHSQNIAYNSPKTLPELFNFRAEMHLTRIKTDELLSSGKIEEAEAYMEQRRAIFWNQGYSIRKLNQAYFAFYGSYAETPGGPAGEDPVGPAVRALRSKSTSLKEFLERISTMTTFSELQRAVIN